MPWQSGVFQAKPGRTGEICFFIKHVEFYLAFLKFSSFLIDYIFMWLVKS